MLSIIIPTLNEEKYLPRLLDSIVTQGLSDYEIIVSDGGSSDQTVSIARAAGVKVVTEGKIKSPSAQRNYGAKSAQGDHLLFLDADSVLPPGFINASLQEFKSRNLKAAAFYIKFNPNRWYYNFYAVISNITCFLKQWSGYPAAIGAGLLVERRLHEVVNGFDLSMVILEDCDYCSRLSRKGKFRMIRSVRLLYSSRRIAKEGFWQIGWKWLRMGVFTIFNRRIKKNMVKYDFGNFDL